MEQTADGQALLNAILLFYGGALLRVGGVVVGGACLALWGRPLLERLIPVEVQLPVPWLWQVTVGLALYGSTLSLLGLAGLYASWSSVALLLAGPLWCARDVRRLWPWVRGVVGRPWVASAPVVPALVLGVCVALLLPAVLAPEIFYDALYYHLGLPAQYLQYGRIVAWPDVVHSAFPATLDLVFGVALAWGDVELAKLLGLVLFVLAAVATAQVTRCLSARVEAGWLAAVLLVTTPGVAIMATMTQVDIGMLLGGAMTLLALLLVQRAEEGRGWRVLLLAGFPLGLMLGSKYTGIYALVASAIAYGLGGGAPWKARLVRCGAVVALAAGLAAPWYVRNAVVFRNPVYPALGGVFGETPASGWVSERLGRDLPQLGLTDLPELLRGLLLGSPSLGAGGELGLLLPFGVLAVLWLVVSDRQVRVPALFVGVFGLLWATQAPAARYLFPVLPLVAAAGGVVLAGLAAHSRLARLGVSLIIVLGALDNLATVGRFEDGFYNPRGELVELLGGRRSRAAYLEALLPQAGAIHWANASLPADAVVLLVGETRPSYLERRAIVASAYDRARLWGWIEESADGKALHERLVAAGITHLFVNRSELTRLRRAYDHLAVPEAEMNRIQGLLRQCRLLHNDGRVQVWAL